MICLWKRIALGWNEGKEGFEENFKEKLWAFCLFTIIRKLAWFECKIWKIIKKDFSSPKTCPFGQFDRIVENGNDLENAHLIKANELNGGEKAALMAQAEEEE